MIELHCTYDPASKGGWTEDERKVRGTLHWVECAHAVPGEVRLYDHLFSSDEPGAGSGDFLEDLNPDSLTVIKDAMLEPSLGEKEPGEKTQFLRKGYFSMDIDSAPGKPVYNRVVGLRDSWAKMQKK